MQRLFNAEKIRELQNYDLDYGFEKETGEFVFPELCISATMRCNLRCKLCVVMSPRYKNPEHPKIEELLEWMDRYFSMVDFTLKIAVSGGEPLMHKDLPILFERLYKYRSKFGRVRINTNGTVIPSNRLIEALKRLEKQAEVLIDRYPSSNNAFAVMEKLTDSGILNILRDYSTPDSYYFDGWVDYGEFDKKRPVNMKCNCRHFALYLRDGRIWMCPSQLLYEDFSPHSEDFIRGYESIDLYSEMESIDEKRKKLVEYWSQDFWESCKWCNGRDETSKRFPPAEQF